MSIPEDEVSSWIGTPREDIPESITRMFDAFDSPCPECNADMVTFAPSDIDSECVCFACGSEFRTKDVDDMVEVAGQKVQQHIENRKERKEQMEAGEYKRKGNKNLAKMLTVIGFMFCLTIIGLPIGAILIYLASRIAPDPED